MRRMYGRRPQRQQERRTTGNYEVCSLLSSSLSRQLVNESAMNGANACPQCRAEMCQAHAREPVSRLESETQETEDDNFTNSMQEETLYDEGKINRESGLFSRPRSRLRRN